MALVLLPARGANCSKLQTNKKLGDST